MNIFTVICIFMLDCSVLKVHLHYTVHSVLYLIKALVWLIQHFGYTPFLMPYCVCSYANYRLSSFLYLNKNG